MIAKGLRKFVLLALATPVLAAVSSAQAHGLGPGSYHGGHHGAQVFPRSSITVGHQAAGRRAIGPIQQFRQLRRTLHPRIWVPGHWQTCERQVWVPGWSERIWVPPVYETRYEYCGTPYQVLLREGHWKTVNHPGRYETRHERVWVPGHYR